MQHLEALPNSGPEAKSKRQLLSEVESLCNGVILLGLPDELAWMFIIDNRDVYNIGMSVVRGTMSILTNLYLPEDYDFRTLRRFTEIFPDLPQTKLIHGYFNYMGNPISLDEAEEEEKSKDGSDTSKENEDEEDPFTTVLVRSRFLLFLPTPILFSS